MRRYHLLSGAGVDTRLANRASRSVAGFIREMRAVGLDPMAHPELVARRPVSSYGKQEDRRKRRAHLKALGIPPDRRNWYAERPGAYQKLMAQLESTDA